MASRFATSLDVALPDAAATHRFGTALAGMLGAGDMILLSGGLGAGKTTLARAVVERLTGDTDVPSPTYTLVQTYDAPDFEVWHADLYRLEEPSEVHHLGLLAVRDEVVSLVEWPERLGGLVPPDALPLELRMAGTEAGAGRTAHLRPPAHTDWAARLEAAGLGR